MARLHVTFGNPTNIGGTSVYAKGPRQAEAITTSGTSQQSTNTALVNEVVSLKVTGGDVYVVAGDNPTASATNGYLMGDGDRLELGSLAVGDEVAVIDA